MRGRASKQACRPSPTERSGPPRSLSQWTEPVQRSCARVIELREIRVEVAALDCNQPLWLKCPFVRGQREIRERDGVAPCDHHQ